MHIFQSINPFNEELIAEFQQSSNNEIQHAINQAEIAQKEWALLPIEQRAIFLLNLAELLKKEVNKLAEIACKEMGKTFEHAKAEILKSASVCIYYAQHAASILASEKVQVDAHLSVEKMQVPMGIVLGIYPWNFPIWQIVRSVIPAVMSGNAVLIKPAPNVPMSCLTLQSLFDKAGFPAALMQSILADEKQIAELIAQPKIAAVTLTGSNRAGAAVAELAGKAIKPVVLELGGSDPFIICEDANLEQVIDHAVFSRFQNNGQSCVSAKRFIVHHTLLNDFEKLLIEKLKTFQYGDPLLPETNMGPLARKDLKQTLERQVKDSLQKGAEMVYQEKNIPKNSAAYNEELFGPVLSIYSFKNETEAIELANDTVYGLGCSIWTQNIENGINISNQINSGMVYINQIVKSDVRFPFGGCKQSGFGKELGPEGLKAFCVLKTRWIHT
jgi:succinate-semialdehyde dehydrogenase/glutarate-semialdehyde dehydrogenase